MSVGHSQEKGTRDIMRKVLIPGTFDPITYGHLDVIKRSSQLFDRVVVGVAASENKGKGPLFTLEERVELAREATRELPNVEIQQFSTLLVSFAKEIGATAIVKGLRATTDFEYEFQMAMLNYHLDSSLETLFVMSSPDYMYVSSSIAKEVASLAARSTIWFPRTSRRRCAESFAFVDLATRLLHSVSWGSYIMSKSVPIYRYLKRQVRNLRREGGRS